MKAGVSALQGWRIQLLGQARLGLGGDWRRLERKEAALLAWLALEGPTARQVLAEHLWPDSGGKAGANLRQLLRRLKLSVGGQVVDGDRVLALSLGVHVDAAALVAGASGDGLESRGVLLEPYGYEDLPDLHDWLTRKREYLAGLRRRALGAELDRLEADGELPRALALAERLLASEPTSEEAWCRLMRLYYLAGDRDAALGLYAQCRRMLQRELEASPLPETEALARVIECGHCLPGAAPMARTRLPASVLRPPVLAGRERAWAAMNSAWAAGQLILVTGEPGIGKSRLARDFAASRGAFLELPGSPGDLHVPYATHRRNLRRVLACRPSYTPVPWVHQELSRLLPELGEPPPPRSAAEDRLRACEATRDVLRQCTQGLAALVMDDLHLADLASLAICAYVLAGLFPLGRGSPHLIACCRDGALSPEVGAMLHPLEEAGMAARVPLEPLSPEAVGRMVEGMGLPGAAGQVAHLAECSGGNPRSVIQAVKHLLETGALGRRRAAPARAAQG